LMRAFSIPPEGTMKTQILKKPLVPILLLGGLWAFFQRGPLFSGETFILADASTVFYPLWKWGGEVLRGGWVPLWCPTAGFGTPYLADPQNLAWYPPKLLLYAFFDPTPAFTFLLLAHSLWGSVGLWCLCRTRGLSSWAALWACLILAFSVNSILLPWSTSMPLAFSWVPWILWAFDKVREGRKGAWLPFSLCLGLQWAAGYPLFGFMTGLYLLLDLLARPVPRKGTFSWRIGIPFLAALGSALLFNLAWLLPLGEMVPLSNLGIRTGMVSSVAWGDLGTFLNPFLLGHPLFTPDKDFIFRVYFAGLPTLVLLVLGVRMGQVPGKALWVWALLLLLTLGEGAWIGGALKSVLPGYQWVVRSGYWIPFLLLFTAWISALALDGLLKRPFKDVRVRGFLVLVLVHATALGVGVPADLASFWVSFFLLAMALGWGGPMEARALLACAGLVLSLFPAARSVHFTTPGSYYDQEPKKATALRGKGRIHQSPEWVEGYRVLSGNGVLDAYSKGKEALVPNWGLAFGLGQTYYSHSLFLKAGLDWEYAPSRVPVGSAGKFLDLLGVGSAVDQALDGRVRFLDRPGALPLWHSVQRAFPSESLEEDWTKIAAKGFDPHRYALVSDGAWAGDYTTRKVGISGQTPNRVVLEAPGKGRALLVSSEMAYPGWRAKVAGQERPWGRVNHDFRGMVLQEGEGNVVMSFEPMTFRLGAFFSLLVCALWGFGLAHRSRRSFRA